MDGGFESAGEILQHFRTLASPDVLDKARKFVIADQMAKMGLNPYFVPFARNEGTEALLEGKRVLMFGSNNYLGLTHDNRVQDAVQKAVQQYGTSYTGSRLLNGTSALHLELERNLADFLGTESALVFATGYQTNLGVFTALINDHSVALVDNYAHASIKDGCTLSGGRYETFKHNDMDDLDRLLHQYQNGKTGCLVAMDGLYSMHGDIAPLPDIVKVVREHGARLLVDDAHAIGAIGPGGRGTGPHFGLQHEVDLVVGTFSKSLASIGGFVAGETSVVNFIKHFGNSMIFSAALAPPNIAAANAALQVLRDEPHRIERLQRAAAKWKKGLLGLGLRAEGAGPIIPVHIGDDLLAFQVWRALVDNGLYVNAAVWPSVPRGGALLRTSVMATHEDHQIEEGLGVFEKVAKQYDLV